MSTERESATPSSDLTIAIEDWKPVGKKNLIGFFTANLRGIRIKDCRLLKSDSGQWVSPPQREYQDRQGARQWASIVEFSEPVKIAIREAVLAAIAADRKEPPPAAQPEKPEEPAKAAEEGGTDGLPF